MSVASDAIVNSVQTVLNTAWDTRDGSVVPDTDSVKLSGGAVKVEATYLYADLARSSQAAQKLRKDVTGKIIRSYLDAASRIIKHYKGEIRSFDGDRVMGIFMGSSKNTQALKAGLGINWAMSEVLKPRFEKRWSNLSDYWTPGHGVGIATGEALIVRGGVRASNDLVSVGAPPNVAAKLSELRGAPTVYCTKETWRQAHESARLSSKDKKEMWREHDAQVVGGKSFAVMSSSWWMRP